MPGYAVDNFFIYAIINAIMPGSGNILALNTMGSYGWEKGKPLLFGIFTGYYTVQVPCAVLVLGVSTFLPNVLRAIKYTGAVYVSWLAIHIAISKLADDNGEKSASFIRGFLLQFADVKIYLFDITALTGYITDYNTSFSALFVAEPIIVIIGTITTLAWIGLGTLLRTVYQKYYRPIDTVLALTLLECTYSMLK